MSPIRRALSCVACAGVLVSGCSPSGAPSAPSAAPGSTASGATIIGLVSGSGPVAASAFAATTTSGLTVTIEGTSVSASVDASGHFRLADVPIGDARLRFSGGSVNATTLVSNVSEGEQIQIQVAVAGATAAILSEVRSTSKVQLCHRTEANKYELIEISTSAEAAHRAHGDGKVGDPVPGQSGKVFLPGCAVG